MYLDASALVKLLFEEAESEALERWITDRADVPKVTSELSTIELLRVCRRVDESSLPDARGLLAALDLIPIAGPIVEQAATVGSPDLQSLDAINLASALAVGTDLAAVVTYDARLAAAAREAGLTVDAPA
jgi:uncharacterized protein